MFSQVGSTKNIIDSACIKIGDEKIGDERTEAILVIPSKKKFNKTTLYFKLAKKNSKKNLMF